MNKAGFSICTLIGIILVILKLFNVITISWWLVLLPFFIEFGLFALIAVILGIGILISVIIEVFVGEDD